MATDATCNVLNERICTIVLLTLAFANFGSEADRRSEAEEPIEINFEQGQELTNYTELDFGSIDTAVVSRGIDAIEHCLRIHNSTPATSCGVLLKGPMTLTKNRMLSFDYRTEIEPGFDGAYLGMIFYVEGEQWFWTSDDFSTEWRHVEIPLGSLAPWRDHTVRPGLVFSGIRLYGRVKDRSQANGETKARMTVYLDNIQVGTSARNSILTDQTRESTSNPPMFQWPRIDSTRDQRLQYSMDPGFPDADTNTAVVPWNFFTPEAALDPGCWYWRVWSSNDLVEGWSDIQRIVIAPEAHRFLTPAAPIDSLRSRSRPRLLPVAQLAEADLTEARKTQWVKSAEKLYKQGIPDHPGVHVPGDPRWPTWIDWYGKVDGKGQAVRKAGADGLITRYFDSPEYGYTLGDASDPEIYDERLARFDRRVLFIKPGLVMIHDLVASSGSPAQYDWMLHAVAPIKSNDAADSFEIQFPRASLRGRFLSPSGIALKTTTGFPVEPVDGYSTRPVPADSYVPEWRLYATPQQPSEKEEFLAIMQVQRLAEPPEPRAMIERFEATGAHGIRIQCGDRTHLILSRKANSQGLMVGEGLESDGHIVAVELAADGKILRSIEIDANQAD